MNEISRSPSRFLHMATSHLFLLAQALVLAALIVLSMSSFSVEGEGSLLAEVAPVVFSLAIPLYVVNYAVRRHLRREEERRDAVKPHKEQVGEVRAAVIIGLHDRAERMRRAALWSLGAIVLSILLGITAFLKAGEIGMRESNSTISNLDSLKRTLVNVADDLRNLREYTLRSDGRIGPNTDWEGVVERQTLALKHSTEKFDQLRGAFEGLDEDMRRTLATQTTHTLITSLSIRIGVTLLLIFLVQILTDLYRYNTRVADFLDSRADALTLSDTSDPIAMSDAVKALASETLTFGRTPKTPLQQAVEVVKQLADNRLTPKGPAS